MDEDFDRRREMRRQKREEMRLEAERMCFQRIDDDEEEAARERRRRARQERLRNKDLEEPVTVETESVAFHGNSVTERETPASQGEDEQALLERLTKREERRQRRMKEALERQREDGIESIPADASTRGHRGWHRDAEEDGDRELARSRPAMEEEEEQVTPKEEEVAPKDLTVEVQGPKEAELEDEQEEKVVEEKPRRSYLREQESVEEKPWRSYMRTEEEVVESPFMSNKELDEQPLISDKETEENMLEKEVEEEGAVVSDKDVGEKPIRPDEEVEEPPLNIQKASEEWSVISKIEAEEEKTFISKTEVEETLVEEVEEQPRMSRKKEVTEEKPRSSLFTEQTGERKPVREAEAVQRRMENAPQATHENGSLHDDSMAKHQKPERTSSRGSMRAAEVEEQDDAARLEAERKLEELKRRRDETESEEFQRMRQKQQEAEAELEELKRKREERRKVLEEEERLKQQELAEKKTKEEEEKRRMKEEIERRRAEAAEKRQKVEDSPDGEPRKPFQCVGPRGASLKIGERAEFLNKSAQKSAVKTSHTPVVSKIDNRLEQYTTAVQTNKEVRSSKSAAIDLPVLTDGIRNIKSMWEKGNAFSSSGAPAATNKDAAGMKIGVAGRISDWLTKAPESSRTAGGKPIDLRPGDVTNKRNLWENKSSAPSKVNVEGKSKSATNGTEH
ncbi:caldesmon-like isoform X1 [Scleropages formosus]|uniref:caldesmon-like isoform X1 n=1 Tax=Scleropages formosus TaxID=113540 RepID=UPI000878F9E9|nr:caldesmon-like isoform X1 [Scleropages formosus]XP_018585527.1 caldesmon-like isoform X1 [Scleropages formosus]